MIRAYGLGSPVVLAFAALLALLALAPEPASAQFYGGWGRRERYEIPQRDIFPSECFTFCRLQYNSQWGGYGRRGRGGSCMTDFPESDLNFSQRLSELTNIRVNRDENGNIKHAVVSPMEDDLFNYPFIYMVEPGSLFFTDEEAERLRSYLLRGGFMLVDDFWGSREWDNFAYEFNKVLPRDEYPIIDLPIEHEIFHIVFDIKKVEQIPGIGYWAGSGGDTSERGADSAVPHIRGVFDHEGRLMVVISHNNDLGDGWEEEAVNPQYFEQFSKRKAYPMGINIVVYAMTH
ncbi:MAG: DUF4159 domain-containing protein [bacterium]|nr:DUF4159 domain-containing protein [bacterium]